jgi:hypothetical protein
MSNLNDFINIGANNANFISAISTANIIANNIYSANSNSNINFWIGSTDVGTISNTSVALGANAGLLLQSTSAVAIGTSAGSNVQGLSSIAIGSSAGNNVQGANAVAIGTLAGNNLQNGNAIAIGLLSGRSSQGDSSVAIGNGKV